MRARQETRFWRGRRGQTLVLVAFFITILLGMVSLTIDLGMAYIMRLRMQQAADSAALAAVLNLNNENAARDQAVTFARLNGFNNNNANCNVTMFPPDNTNGTVQVRITQPMRTFFMSFLGIQTLSVGAQATARFRTLLPIPISGGGTPGAATTQTLSIWGRYSAKFNGDPYSPQFLPNGTPNPDFRPGGYNFTLSFPAGYPAAAGTDFASIAIFDPDIFQNGVGSTANIEFDEIASKPAGITLPPGVNTNSRGTTSFKLFAPDSTPSDFTDDVLIAQFITNGSNNVVQVMTPHANGNGFSNTSTGVTPNGHWITLASVDVNGNANALKRGPYRINVESFEGSSENGFDIVAVPAGFINQNLSASITNSISFNANKGRISFPNANSAHIALTSGTVEASGYLPINFRTTATVNIPLGVLPQTTANLNVHVIKFDTDVGTNANSVHYFDDAGSVNNLLGTTAANNSFAQDDIVIPGPYAGGGFRATYTASTNDTSVWSSFYDGFIDGEPGRPQLID